MAKYDYCIFIGRFSPFHKAHKFILNQALALANKVVVVIGSAESARTIRNPWTAVEREQMIVGSFSPDELNKIIFIHLQDFTYNDNLWISVLQQKINEATNYSNNISLIGFESDETSYYLKLFPQYQYIQCSTEYKFHASKIRDLYFSFDNEFKATVPESVIDYLNKFRETKEFSTLKQEKDFIDSYKEQWRGAPFSPIFVTVDAVVIKSGHILIIRRKRNPGKNKFALPGGFIRENEKLQDAALRKLKEETGIKINVGDLRKSIIDFKVFDDPQRSARGRTISNAYLIDLGMGMLPQIKGDNADVDRVEWLPLNNVRSMSNEFFEDHWHIINYFTSKF